MRPWEKWYIIPPYFHCLPPKNPKRMSKSILLTGGAGYIGSHTFLALLEAGYQPIIFDDYSNAKRDVPQRLAQISGAEAIAVAGNVLDATALAQVFAKYPITAVIHFAGRKAVGESVAIPLAYFESNIAGMTTLLTAMQAAGIFRIVFSSSCTVYGEPQKLPITEAEPRSYTNPYGFTKLICEQILEQLVRYDRRWQVGILRYFNPVGAHESALIGEDPTDLPNNLMPLLARVANGDMPHLQVFGDDYDTPDGTAVRDYIHVSDLAEGHVQCLAALAKQGGLLTVNLGTGQGYSVLEMIAAYSRACGRQLPFVMTDRRPGDVPITYANPTRAKQLLGFHARRNLDEMCHSSWRWVSRAGHS